MLETASREQAKNEIRNGLFEYSNRLLRRIGFCYELINGDIHLHSTSGDF